MNEFAPIKPDVPKQVLLQPNNLIAYVSLDGEVILTTLSKVEDYMLFTVSPMKKTGFPIVNWLRLLQRERIIISPN